MADVFSTGTVHWHGSRASVTVLRDQGWYSYKVQSLDFEDDWMLSRRFYSLGALKDDLALTLQSAELASKIA